MQRNQALCRSIAPVAHEGKLLTFAITFERLYDYPSFTVDAGHEVVTRVKAWTGSNAEAKVAYGTEAGYFSGTLGIPTIVCGPGSIEQAHKPTNISRKGNWTCAIVF